MGELRSKDFCVARQSNTTNEVKRQNYKRQHSQICIRIGWLTLTSTTENDHHWLDPKTNTCVLYLCNVSARNSPCLAHF